MSAPKTKAPQSLLSLMYWAITIGILLAGVILVLALSPPANASGCDHNCNKTITVIVEKDDGDDWKKYAWGAVHACRSHAVWVGVTENRWLTWCGEREKPRPLPNPGPVPNDVTPDIQPNRIIFK